MFSKFLFTFLILFISSIFVTNNSNANIYQLTCKNKKNTTTWVHSFKRKAVILSKLNNNKTKVSFTIKRNTNDAFMATGVLSNLKTGVTYDEQSKVLSVTQPSLRGSNQFYDCSKPKLLKEE